jgi:hypothetical protein
LLNISIYTDNPAPFPPLGCLRPTISKKAQVTKIVGWKNDSLKGLTFFDIFLPLEPQKRLLLTDMSKKGMRPDCV